MNFQKIISIFSLLSIIVPASCSSKTNATALQDSIIGDPSVTIRGAVRNYDNHDGVGEEAVVIQPLERHLNNDVVCVNRKRYYRSSQRFALIQLFSKFGLENYFGRDSSSDECAWTGVTCRDGVVVGLRLPKGNDFDFDTEITTRGNSNLSELALLENLEILDFSNQILMRGVLPDLRKLKNLTFLDVSYTRLIGAASNSNLCVSDGRSKVVSYTPTGGTGYACDCGPDDTTLCLPKYVEFRRVKPV